MLITFPHKLVHDKKIQAMNVQRDHSFRCQCEMDARQDRVSRILLIRESLPGTDEVGGNDCGKYYLLSTYHLALHTVSYFEVCHTTKIEATRSAGRFALTSDQQHQCSSVMMHPSGHHAARRQSAATLRYRPANLVQHAR